MNTAKELGIMEPSLSTGKGGDCHADDGVRFARLEGPSRHRGTQNQLPMLLAKAEAGISSSGILLGNSLPRGDDA